MGLYIEFHEWKEKGLDFILVVNFFIVLWETEVVSLLLQILLEILFICALKL